jgi:hypothetical protein
MKAWARVWGMRHGVRYAEPLFHAYGSMDTTRIMRRIKCFATIPC